MPIGVSEEHEQLHEVVTRWCEAHCPPAVPRARLDADHEERPEFWDAMREPGWFGLHLAEGRGGAGYGLPELAVVVEELGRVLAPGPFVPGAIAAAIIELGDVGGEVAGVVARLAAGDAVAVVALSGVLDGEADGDSRRVSGTLPRVMGAHLADFVVAPLRVDGAEEWCVLEVAGPAVSVREVPGADLTRRVAEVRVDGAAVGRSRRLPELTREKVRSVAAAVFACEAVGVAQWCVDTASEYAKVRVQFGRPIGQFQAVKHRCADMLARVELARAAAWDAVRAVGDDGNGADVAVASGAALAFDAAYENAKDCVQTLGGIGFTWEHDAHMYLRRAIVLHEVAGSPVWWRRRAAEAALAGSERRLAVELPAEAEQYRGGLRELLAELQGLDERRRRERLVEDGYVTPSWPRPWGRDAGAVELAVIEEEFRTAGIQRPQITIGSWALPPLIVYGTAEQQERWIRPTLLGDINWCQLFSEPGAGSDLASLSTRATRVEGGYVVNGQKVWTSLAREAGWGILLARTDPDAPKHDGISCFMLDMHTPGIEIRPLRELTGMAMFNEVFFDDVFVPEDCRVGAENDGWRCARTTLANERVFMGSGSTVGTALAGVLRTLRGRGFADDPLALDAVGDLVVRGHALAVLGYRLTLSALRGADPSGSEAAVRKLLGVDHDQRVQEVGLLLCGEVVAGGDAEAQGWVFSFLFNRCLSIAGGTSDIQRNVIAERLLGLPRDP